MRQDNADRRDFRLYLVISAGRLVQWSPAFPTSRTITSMRMASNGPSENGLMRGYDNGNFGPRRSRDP